MKSNVILPLLLATVFPAFGQSGEVPPIEEVPPITLKDVAQQAVLNSPEVLNKWHAFRAATEEIDVGRAGFYPRADLTMGGGKERLEQSGVNNSYTRTGYQITFNQMIYDGFATASEVKRLGKAKLVRYYELLDASENTALEAARAYIDVLRYRALYDLAQDNYVQHKATYEQLLRRTQSGVGRRVDLEQAGSRLALAEVNLTTELANLHDVTARYQRLVGGQPPVALSAPGVAGGALPENAAAALNTLLQRNPSLLAAVENVEASQFEIEGRRAAYMPRLDFRASANHTNNYLGTPGVRDFGVAELVMNWNIFNGGADVARERQAVEKKNVSLDMREKACRDTRQTLVIAYNDVQRLQTQTSYLNQQVALLAKTRDAYRDQFNIGQRTLLDLLDTENEFLQARRSIVNAEADMNLAYLRTYAGMGTLLEQLGLQKVDAEAPAAGDLATVDASALCPADAIVVATPDHEALNAKAAALVNAGRPAPAPSFPQAAVASANTEVGAQVKAWASAWSSKNYKAYAAFYAPSFTPEGGMTREDWASLRRNRVTNPGSISVEVSDLRVRLEGGDRAVAEFRQNYRSSSYSDVTQKTLEMIRVGGKWLINRESSVVYGGKR